MPSMLQVWAEMRPSTALKEEIVDFFSLQIRAHHPKGVKTADEGTAVCLRLGFLKYQACLKK